MGVLILLSLAAIPASVLVSSLRDRSLRRRSHFRLRCAAFALAMALPWMIELPSAISQQGSLTLLWVGLGWGLVLVAAMPLLLFTSAAPDPGSSDDGGPGPGPEDEPRPRPPIGGIPLPDAEPSARRVRGDHGPGRTARPRRPAREPARRRSAPSRTRH